MTRLTPKKRAAHVSNRKTQRFLAVNYRLDLLEHIGQRCRVHYLRGRVADFLHYESDCTSALVAAFTASHVRHLADTWQRCDWSVQYAYNVPNADQLRIAAKEVSAALTLLALEQSLVLEFEQDQFQKRARNIFALGQVRYKHGSLTVFLIQFHHRLEGVFRLFRKHFIDL